MRAFFASFTHIFSFFIQEYPVKKQISVPGEIRREYEVQLQMVEEEMRRQRERDRLASEAIIKKIQQEEEQEKLVQLAQDQLLAKTLAKREVIDKINDKSQRSGKSTTVNSDRSNVNVSTNVNQSKLGGNQKMSVKSKEQNESRKLNAALISKIRKHSSTVKSSTTNPHKDSTKTFSSQKPVPIHNAVTRVVTHQSRGSQPNSATYQALVIKLRQ